MITTLKLFNNTETEINIAGLIIEPNNYVDISESDKIYLRDDENLFNLIANEKIIVNNGEKDLTPLKGWNFIQGNVYPPTTDRGYWQIVQKKEALTNNNKLVSWYATRFIDADTKFVERMIIPEGEEFFLEQISFGSPNVPVYACLEFFVYVSSKNEYLRFNPNIDIRMFKSFYVTVTADVGETNINVEFYTEISGSDYLPLDSMYGAYNTNGNISYHIVKNINNEQKIITVSAPLKYQLNPGAVFALVDRPILSFGSEKNTTIVNFNTPIGIKGNGKSYLKLSVENLSESDPGIISCMVNGYTSKV